MTLLHPAMPRRGGSPTPGALWIGELEVGTPVPPELVLSGSDGFSRARLLLRVGGLPVGFAEVDVADGRVDLPSLREQVAALRLPWRPRPQRDGEPAVSVVLCTRDRPESLPTALESLQRMTYPQFEVVVVDNAPSGPGTRAAVVALGDPRFRLVKAPVPGLARARNAGVLAARHSIVAFTDDDVVVDPGWLNGIALGFEGGSQVGCVCGMVPSGELACAAQLFFDRRVAWASSIEPETFSLAGPRSTDPLFPFHVGRYGTGANFALRREVALTLGGFDEALGAGSPTGGGEDTDMFLRVLLSGSQLAYEPAALVWHRHRADVSSLTGQLRAYGTGMGACLAKLAMSPRTARMLARRAALGVRHAWRMTRVQPPGDWGEGQLVSIRRQELLAMCAGPLLLRRARRAGARPTPLLGLTPTHDDHHLEAIP